MKYHFVKEHPESFELKHPDGSHFHVAKNVLNKSMTSKIHGLPKIMMADGGEVPGLEDNKSTQPEEPKDTLEDLPKMSEGETAVQNKMEYLNKNQPGLYAGNYDLLRKDAENQVLAEKQTESNVQNVNENKAKALADRQAQETKNYNAEAAKFGLPLRQEPVENQPIQDQTTQPGQSQSVYANRQPQSSSVPMPDLTGRLNLGLSEIESGIKGETAANAKTAQMQANAYNQYVQNVQKTQQDYETQKARLDQEHEKLASDVMNSRIDPNRLWSDSSTGGKIAAAIGMIFSGVGSATSGQPNLALKVIEDSITRDVDAQKAELGKKENLLSDNLRRYGDLHTAYQATLNQLNAVVQGQLGQAMAQNGTQMAISKGMQALGQFHATSTAQIGDVALRQASLNAVNTVPSGPDAQDQRNAMIIRSPLVPDHLKEPMFKELKSAQGMAAQVNNANDIFDTAAKLQTLGARAGSPIQSKAKLDALIDPFMANITKETEGRVTPTDVDLMKPLMPKMTDDASTLALKRKQLNAILSERNQFPMLTSYGIRVGGPKNPLKAREIAGNAK